MNKILKKINIKVNPTEERGIFHDSRKDVKTISKALNICIDKINELVTEYNLLFQKNSNNKTL